MLDAEHLNKLALSCSRDYLLRAEVEGGVWPHDAVAALAMLVLTSASMMGRLAHVEDFEMLESMAHSMRNARQKTNLETPQ